MENNERQSGGIVDQRATAIETRRFLGYNKIRGYCGGALAVLDVKGPEARRINH